MIAKPMAERTSGHKKRVINDDEMKDMLLELVDSCSQAGTLRGKFSGGEIRQWLKRRFAVIDAAKELGLIKDDPAINRKKKRRSWVPAIYRRRECRRLIFARADENQPEPLLGICLARRDPPRASSRP